jgi:hypothetical protein
MPEDENSQSDLYRTVSAELIKAASAVAGFKLKKPQFASAANVSGIRTVALMFSQRHDSRTIFASDNSYGHGRKAGAWTGSDKTAIAACRAILGAAKTPPKEVAGVEVVSEMGQVSERASDGEVRAHKPTVLRKLARARRTIEGIPVWHSYVNVGLNFKGQLGWLELHWPEIPLAIVKEGGVLRALVKRGFKAPDLPGARVEAVEAGFIHSPAIGFFMDIGAAIRIIYSGQQPSVGRKSLLYLDRHGNPVTLPRDIEPAKLAAGGRSAPHPPSAG